jgi:nucleoside-diphosphate-sugar epimerase
VNANDELVAADLTNEIEVDHAVAGSEIVYLVAGLPYKLKTWQQQWPQVMRNVVRACEKHQAKLVFFDNIYLYEASSVPHLTENSPINPPSKKGRVRAAIAQMITDSIAAGRLTAMIVRAADFYGPGINSSMLLETVYKNLRKGKAAYWMGDKSKVHSFTYTPDAAKATALLGNTPDAYNQVWHLPTSDEKLTGEEWVKLFADAMQTKNKISPVSKTMVQLLGLFNPMMRELTEMMYQNTQDYFFDCSKFKKRFPEFVITPYNKGVKAVVGAG